MVPVPLAWIVSCLELDVQPEPQVVNGENILSGNVPMQLSHLGLEPHSWAISTKVLIIWVKACQTELIFGGWCGQEVKHSSAIKQIPGLSSSHWRSSFSPGSLLSYTLKMSMRTLEGVYTASFGGDVKLSVLGYWLVCAISGHLDSHLTLVSCIEENHSSAQGLQSNSI